MGNDLCSNQNPQKISSTINIKTLQIKIIKYRKQFKQQLPIPQKITQKIISLLQIPTLQHLYKNSKIWKVDLPNKFIYINQPKNKQQLPTALCSILLLSNNTQFISFFNGYINKNGIRQNQGSLYVFANGDYYQGDKNKNDYGLYFDHQGEYKYQGDWVNGKPHGIGKQYTKMGSYQGYFLNGKKNGNGKYMFKDGFIYEGQFTNNEIVGEGSLSNQKKKYSYIGHFINGQKHGHGTQKTDKYTYKGIFNRNKKQKNGKLIFINDNVEYQGQFQYNLPNGKGKIKNKNYQLDGIWEQGKLVAVTNYQIFKC